MRPESKIHLVSYASPHFRHRQWVLGTSARLNRVVSTVHSWSKQDLIKAGFKKRFEGIRLTDRGAGFWAWKPFIILRCLEKVPDGELVLYSDVGRVFPFKKLDYPLGALLDWMRRHDQDMVPGLEIPWVGTMEEWTKRDAFVEAGLDRPEIHGASQVQASFSLWRNGSNAREFVGRWLDWCSRYQLVSDAPSMCGLPELPAFREHRFDQALLSLCCFQFGVGALNVGDQSPVDDARNPCAIARWLEQDRRDRRTGAGKLLEVGLKPIEWIEEWVRAKSLGLRRPEFRNTLKRS